MGRRRFFEENKVYSVTARTVDRQFLYTPNHHPMNDLISFDSALDSLDPSNLKMPKPSIKNIIGFAAARAQELYPLDILWHDGNSNQIHLGFLCTRTDAKHISKFMQHLFTAIAKEINAILKREGPLNSSRYHVQSCRDDESALQQLLYAVTNPVKDGLVTTVEESPFISTYKHLVYGQESKFWNINRTAFHRAGGQNKKGNHPKQYLEWKTLVITPLPHLADMKPNERQKFLKAEIEAIEKSERHRRKMAGEGVLGEKKLRERDPRDRPKTPKDSGPQPLCHAASREEHLAFIELWRDFNDRYNIASASYRSGLYETEFPEGSYKPPLIDIQMPGG